MARSPQPPVDLERRRRRTHGASDEPPAPGAVVPPHNLEAEEAVLGAMMISAGAREEVRRILRDDPEVFYLQRHRLLFEAICELDDIGYPVDELTVMTEMRDNSVLDDIGGAPYLHTLVSMVPSAGHAPWYARAIVADARRRGVLDAATQAASGAVEAEDPDELLASLEAALQPLRITDDDEGDDRPAPVDVVEMARGIDPEDTHTRYVIDAFMIHKTVTAIFGEEGDGKSMLAEQICRQLVRGDKIAECFAPGGRAPARALFIDTEMTEDEVAERQAQMEARGLHTAPGTMFWMCAGPLDLARAADDQAYVRRAIARVADGLGPDEEVLVWIDAGGNSVPDPNADEDVRPMFNWLKALARDMPIAGIGITLHARKRTAEQKGRTFDDVYGAREWKGRPAKVFYIDSGRIRCEKDRGGAIRRMWPITGGLRKPQATLERPGYETPTEIPFRIVYRPDETDQINIPEVREAILNALEREPGLSKNAAAKRVKDGGIKVKRQIVFGVIETLLSDGTLGKSGGTIGKNGVEQGVKLWLSDRRPDLFDPAASIVDEGFDDAYEPPEEDEE